VLKNVCDRQWASDIAISSEQFAETIKARLHTKAMGRQVREVPGGYALREEQSSYNFGFDPQKGDIGLENTYNWSSFH
jgi:hypothetical protein